MSDLGADYDTPQSNTSGAELTQETPKKEDEGDSDE